MASVEFTSALRRFFPDLTSTTIQGETIMEVLSNLELRHKGLLHYLIDDQKSLRKHVNIFIDGSILTSRDRLDRPINGDTELFIVQALSGG